MRQVNNDKKGKETPACGLFSAVWWRVVFGVSHSSCQCPLADTTAAETLSAQTRGTLSTSSVCVCAYMCACVCVCVCSADAENLCCSNRSYRWSPASTQDRTTTPRTTTAAITGLCYAPHHAYTRCTAITQQLMLPQHLHQGLFWW